MTVHEFELLDGVVLTKLVRSDRPITLRMIETRPDEACSAYKLNDEVDLFIKHRTTSRSLAGGKGRSWSFVFGIDQLQQMSKSTARAGVYIALVCASRQVKDPQRCVCLLYPREVKELLDFSVPAQQPITIKYSPGRSLRVYKGRKETYKVPQNRLEKWSVPGS